MSRPPPSPDDAAIEPTIYVDADACPVKAETVKVADRHGLPVVFVANAWMQAPRGARARMQVVAGSFDAADDWIAGGPKDRSRFLERLELVVRQAKDARA